MFGRPKSELPVPPGVKSGKEAAELFRGWIVDGGLQVMLVPSLEKPALWGLVLADLARHAARAHADQGDITEAEALLLIRTMFQAEWESPTDLGTTNRQ